jgi:hypothetical protein
VRLVLLAVPLAALSLAACAKAAPAAPTPTTATTITATAAGPTDCGVYDLGLGSTLPPTAAQCLVDAATAGQPARLTVTRSTTEGDPIPVTYTARPGGKVEVVTDTREDAFGERKITTEICAGPSPTDHGIDFTTCVPIMTE